jgi:hypothetical protein
MDVFLLFFGVSCLGIFLLINAKMLYYYEEEDAKLSENLFLKAVVIIAWTMAYSMVTLLPIDVRVTRMPSNGLDMQEFWVAMFITVVVRND